jgi:hypothetical protein
VTAPRELARNRLLAGPDGSCFRWIVDSPPCLVDISDVEVQCFGLILQRTIFSVPGHGSRSDRVVCEAPRDQPLDLAHVFAVEIAIEFFDLKRIVDELA